MVYDVPTIGPDGTLYLESGQAPWQDRTLWAITKDGTVRFSVPGPFAFDESGPLFESGLLIGRTTDGVLAIDSVTAEPTWKADATTILETAAALSPGASAVSISHSLMSPSDGVVVVSAMIDPRNRVSDERWQISLAASTGQMLEMDRSTNRLVAAVGSADGFEFMSTSAGYPESAALECRQPSGAWLRSANGELAGTLAPWSGKLLATMWHAPPGGPLLAVIDPLTCAETGRSLPINATIIRTSGDAVFVSGTLPPGLSRVDPDQGTILWSIPWNDSAVLGSGNFVPTSSRSLVYLDAVASDQVLVRAVSFDGKPLWDCAPTVPVRQLLALEEDQLILIDENGGVVSYEAPGLAPARDGWVTEAGDPENRHRPAVPEVLP